MQNLQEKIAILEQKLNKRDELLSYVSFEIGSPINSLKALFNLRTEHHNLDIDSKELDEHIEKSVSILYQNFENFKESLRKIRE